MRKIILLATTLFAIMHVNAQPATTTFYSASTPVKTKAINRNDILSKCATPKAFPGTSVDDAYHISATYFNKSAVEVCYNLSYATFTDSLIISIYLGDFDPNNLATGYLADGGFLTRVINSVTVRPQAVDSGKIEFKVPANSKFTVVQSLLRKAAITSFAGVQFTFADVASFFTPAATTFTGSITPTDLSQTGRIVRDGFTNSCPKNKGAALQNATPVKYDAQTFTNTSPSTQCYQVYIDMSGCASQSTQANVYSTFTPSTPNTGVIGDAGFSTVGGFLYQFVALPGQNFTIVVHEIVAGSGCPVYAIKFENAYVTTLLPIVINEFKGKSIDANTNKLTWSTLSEVNGAAFEIERSPNGTEFQTIGSVPASSQGNVKKEYSFTDKNVKINTNFYRLKLVDKDGSFKYTGVVVIKSPSKSLQEVFTVYPNPANEGMIKILSAKANSILKVTIIDQMGRVVKTFTATSNETINIREIPTGIYSLKIYDGESQETIKLIKK